MPTPTVKLQKTTKNSWMEIKVTLQTLEHGISSLISEEASTLLSIPQEGEIAGDWTNSM